MKNFILKNKIKILFILFFAFLLVFLNNNVFAYTEEQQNLINDLKTQTGKSNLDVMFITSNDSDTFIFWKANDRSVAYIEYSSSQNLFKFKYSDESFNFYVGNIAYYKNGSFQYSSSTSDCAYVYQLLCDKSSTTSSILDIYKDGESIPFFKLAPQGIVARQVETLEMGQVLQEVLGILPLIIVVVVSLVGLRKGLTMLFNLLHKA